MNMQSQVLKSLFQPQTHSRKPVMLLNGSNLNMLGKRDPQHYGTRTLAEVEESVIIAGADLGVEVVVEQSNIEGELINTLHNANGTFAAVLFNPGGYTHTSVALRDAIESIDTPVYEVHMSNVHAREEFRSTSMISAVCAGTISGCGEIGYTLALLSAVAKSVQTTSAP
ncbi:MAG: type II 3-dehydroquinate dehydratase [Brevibacterium sp.]